MSVLIQGLPPTSLLAQAVHGPGAGWGDQEELAAAAVDRLGEALYWLQGIAGVRTPAWLPPVPRPGDAPTVGELVAPPPMSSPTEIKAFFGTDVPIVVGA